MDFYGRGYITEEDFLSSSVVQRIPFTRDDVKEFFRQYNVFTYIPTVSTNADGSTPAKAPEGSLSQGIAYDKFKKMFFPQLFLINDGNDSDDDKAAKKNQNEMKKNSEE